MLYPQNGDGIVTIDAVTSLNPVHKGDMIELSKITKGIYDPVCIPHFHFMELSGDLIRSGGNKYKLVQHHC